MKFGRYGRLNRAHLIVVAIAFVASSCQSNPVAGERRNPAAIQGSATIVGNDNVEPAIAVYECMRVHGSTDVLITPFIAVYRDGRVVLRQDSAPEGWFMVAYIDPHIVEKSQRAIDRYISRGPASLPSDVIRWNEISMFSGEQRKIIRAEAPASRGEEVPFREAFADCIFLLVPIVDAIAIPETRSEQNCFRRICF